MVRETSEKDMQIMELQDHFTHMTAGEKSYALSLFLESSKDDPHPSFRCNPIERLLEMARAKTMPTRLGDGFSKKQKDILNVQSWKYGWVYAIRKTIVKNAYEMFLSDHRGASTTQILQVSLIEARKIGIESTPRRGRDIDVINNKDTKSKVCTLLRVAGMTTIQRRVKESRIRVWIPDVDMWETINSVAVSDAITYLENRLALTPEEIKEFVE